MGFPGGGRTEGHGTRSPAGVSRDTTDRFGAISSLSAELVVFSEDPTHLVDGAFYRRALDLLAQAIYFDSGSIQALDKGELQIVASADLRRR